MKKLNIIVIAVMLVSVSIGFIACKKNDTSSNLQIRLTDAPTNLKEVNVDIQQINVKFDDDTSNTSNGWVALQTNARVYNLLRLQNGIDTLLASAPVQQGILKQIRFVLGPNNTVKDTFNVVSPLTIPSGSESGLKIKISKKLGLTLETLVLDFDTDLSIKKEISGYKLRPVIKLK